MADKDDDAFILLSWRTCAFSTDSAYDYRIETQTSLSS